MVISGIENDVIVAKNLNFDYTAVPPHLGVITANGDLLIGSIGTTPNVEISKGVLTSPTGTILVGYAYPNITLDTAAAAFAYTNVTFAMSPYTVLNTDFYLSLNTSGGAITISLPNSPVQYTRWIIKDRTGNASANNVTVTTVGGAVLLDGATTYVIGGNYGSIQLLFNGTSYEVY